jgi:hypothetical protein
VVSKASRGPALILRSARSTPNKPEATMIPATITATATHSAALSAAWKNNTPTTVVTSGYAALSGLARLTGPRSKAR